MRRWIGIALVVGIAVGGYECVRAWRGRAPFNSDRVAAAETRMWQAYYAQQPQALALELTVLLHTAFGMEPETAKETVGNLAQAALVFKYEGGGPVVQEHLEAAYGSIKEAIGATWDAKEAAEAELAWWVARRTEGRNDPELVGRKIAHLYEVLAGFSNAHIEKAGQLRAEAAAMRDRGGLVGPSASWKAVENKLRESYRELAIGLREGGYVDHR
jgi:hypothetical protein